MPIDLSETDEVMHEVTDLRKLGMYGKTTHEGNMEESTSSNPPPISCDRNDFDSIIHILTAAKDQLSGLRIITGRNATIKAEAMEYIEDAIEY